MARYRVDEKGSTVSIEVSEVGGNQDRLLAAFGECQAGQCSCPTDEYQKLASMEVEEAGGIVRLRLEAKRGERFDTSEIAACLDYTAAKVADAEPQD